jgi:hypothetical protein
MSCPFQVDIQNANIRFEEVLQLVTSPKTEAQNPDQAAPA